VKEVKTFHYLQNLSELKPLPVEEKNGKRFYISPNGVYLPSVTTVLGHFKKQSITEWRNRVGVDVANAISGRASVRGTKFHNMLEKYLRNDRTLLQGIMPDMKQAFLDAKSTLDLIDNIHYIESSLYSESLGIAGRTDVIAEYDGVLSVIDFKTSLRTKKEDYILDYFLQGTAYSLMYEELVGNPIEQVVIIISTDDSNTPQVFCKNRVAYIEPLLEKILAYKKEN